MATDTPQVPATTALDLVDSIRHAALRHFGEALRAPPVVRGKLIALSTP